MRAGNPFDCVLPAKLRWLVFMALALLAFVIRLPGLGDRPMHTDEATNAYILGQLLAGHSFHYDPVDRHGPALAAFTLPLVKLEGARKFSELTEAGLRLSPVLAGTATVLMWGAGIELFGFVACVVAALIFVFAPLPFYYHRYFIHESLFVAATLGLILAGGHALRRHSVLAAGLAGFCAAVMLAAKETAPLHFGCLLFAGLVVWLAARREVSATLRPGDVWEQDGKDNFASRRENSASWRPERRMLLAGFGVFAITLILLFTWFGQNWGVFGDLMRAVPNFTARAAGQGHEKPFWYYAKLLAGGWSGAALLTLAVAGAGLSLFSFGGRYLPNAKAGPGAGIGMPPARMLRVFSLYGLAIFLLYSLIPYKTPWLALNFWPAIALMSGVAVEWFWFSQLKFLYRVMALALLILLGALMLRDTWQRVFVNPAGAANPYAYAHTVADLLGLPPRLAQLCRERHLADPRIAVVAADPWPLPWYLRQYPQVGFWLPGQDPGLADFFVTSPAAAEKMAGALSHYRPEYFGLRPEVLIILWTPEPGWPETSQP
jgi:uncharacterized protein (TIGR03663 family)